jgi:hypothetical protein
LHDQANVANPNGKTQLIEEVTSSSPQPLRHDNVVSAPETKPKPSQLCSDYPETTTSVAAVAAVLVIVVIAAFAYFNGRSKAGDLGPGAIQSIAVLPFIDEAGDPDAEYINDKIAESLINSLSRIRN